MKVARVRATFFIVHMQKAEIEKLIESLADAESAELVDLRFSKEGAKWVLRVYLDKAGGLTLDDCAYFSDRIGSLLDCQNAVDGAYVLEVSSPGLDRVIKKEKDFERFVGKMVKVRLKIAENGQRNYKGKLIGLENGNILIEDGGRRVELPFAVLDEARLDYASEI